MIWRDCSTSANVQIIATLNSVMIRKRLILFRIRQRTFWVMSLRNNRGSSCPDHLGIISLSHENTKADYAEMTEKTKKTKKKI